MIYPVSDFNGDALLAYSKLKSGDKLVINIPISLPSPLIVSTPFVTIENNSVINCGGQDVGIEFKVPSILTGRGAIINAKLSAVMVLGPNCLIENQVIYKYNQLNKIGHAGIFGYKCTDLIVRHCKITFGNGNGIRLDGVINSLVYKNKVSLTQGNSSEGITLGSTNILCLSNEVDRANVTGILVFGGPYSNITVVRNKISNSSQLVLGAHPAIGIAPEGNTIDRLFVYENEVYDTQVIHTQSHLASIYGPGKISNGMIFDNKMWDCIDSSQVVVSTTPPIFQNFTWS